MSSTHFMEEMLYVFLFTFSYCRSFSLWWPLPLLIFPMRYKMFMFFFQQNWSLSLKLSWKKELAFLLLFFISISSGSYAIYCQNGWVQNFTPAYMKGRIYIRTILSEPKFLGCIDKFSYPWCSAACTSAINISWNNTILRDPGAVGRVGRKGGTKVFKYGQKSPWVPTLTELFPKIQADAGSWLGTKNALYYCAQLANSFSCVLFVSSYTTAIVLIKACLDAPKKCTQSANKIPIWFQNIVCPKTKDTFPKI